MEEEIRLLKLKSDSPVFGVQQGKMQPVGTTLFEILSLFINGSKRVPRNGRAID